MSNLVFKILNDNGDIEITRFAKAEAVFKNPEYINEIFTEKKYINIFEMGKENEKLQQENQQLKEELQDLKADYGTIAQIERDLYKEVIEEVRGFIEKYRLRYRIDDYDYYKDKYDLGSLDEEQVDELLQILDKVKGE